MALKANQPIRWKERIGIIAVGHTFKQAEEVIFDYTLYPAVIAWLGAVTGGLVMTALSATVCYFYVLFYDWSKKDWFGYELLKRIRDGEEKQGTLLRVIQWASRRGDWIAFLLLSCLTDPFETTVYMRYGVEEYNGLSKRDWKIFGASVIVANVWWTGAMTLVVAGIRLLLKRFGFN